MTMPTANLQQRQQPQASNATALAPLVQAQGLSCQRGDRMLFVGLDLLLPAGSITWLRGGNGRGKTSLLRLLAGLSTPVAGKVLVAGQDTAKAGPGWRSHWVYLGHQNALKDDLSAFEALAFLASLHGLPHSPQAVKDALASMGIANRTHAPVRTLSQGQRRRVALARLALSASAPVWLLDEPFDALDAQGIEALNGLIATHARNGGCVLLTSHQALSLDSGSFDTLDLDLHAQVQDQNRGQAQTQRAAQT